jgi:hypothetical protein
VEEKPGFFSRLFGSGDKKEESLPPPTEAVAPVPLESAGLLEFDPLAYNFDMTRVNPKQQRITVEINETLGHYSEWARTSPAVLRRLNRLGARAGLIQGKSFILPLDDSKAMEFHLQRIRFHQAIEEDLYAIYKITGEVDYKIEKGDTIASICRKLDLPFWLLRKYQPDISRSRLAVGRVIRVPTLQPIRPADEPSAAPDEPEGE